VQRQQQPDPIGRPEAIGEQVGGLGDPVGRGAAGELDAGGPVEVGEQRLGGLAPADKPCGQVVQGLSAAVLTGVLPVVGAFVGGAPDTVTFCAPL
jgi:hypothetical protein